MLPLCKRATVGEYGRCTKADGGDALDVVRVLVEAVHARVRGVRLGETDGGVGLPRGDESVHGLDIMDHGDDAAREEEQEGDDAERAGHIEADEDVWACGSARTTWQRPCR